MSRADGIPANSIHPKSRAEWRAWLEQNHNQAKGIWLISYSKTSGKPRIEYEEAVEEALCFGWVDSKGKKLDGERTMLWYGPRRPGSGWARTNKGRVEKLIAAGRMAPAGLAKVEAAKQDGSWYALDGVEALEIPPDLEAALAAHGKARENWDALPRYIKRNALLWITTARRPETRAKRIQETARLAAENKRPNR